MAKSEDEAGAGENFGAGSAGTSSLTRGRGAGGGAADTTGVSFSSGATLTKNPSISRELGTRHRAAIGITEGSDAISIIISEETGLISFAENGTLTRNLDTHELRAILLKSMDLPVIEKKREPTKTMKEPETEITIG